MKTNLTARSSPRSPHCRIGITVLLLLTALTGLAAPTDFTYQGRLTENGAPVNGTNDLTFTLYNSANGGVTVGVSNVVSDLAVTNGLFTVTLDYGANAFDGSARWLEIAVRPGASAGAYTSLAPRQPITTTPYAIRALNAGSATTAATASSVAAGAVTSAGLAAGSVGGAAIADGSITGADLNAGLLNNTFWKLVGNDVAPGQFLGSTNSQPVDLRANNFRVLRLEPRGVGNPPNLVGGYHQNIVNGGGSTIAGGGTSGAINQTDGDYGFIGAGIGGRAFEYSMVGAGAYNSALASFSMVGAGIANTNRGESSAIVAGSNNIVALEAYSAFIGAGRNNQALGAVSTIGGGEGNTIQPNATYATIGGGVGNTNGSSHSMIAGGLNNWIQPNASLSSIGGGWLNSIQEGADQSVIAGGNAGLIQGGARESFIGGGFANTIQTNARASTIGGGTQNTIQPDATWATIGGGVGNANGGWSATIGGGQANLIQSAADRSSIGGGANNTIVGSHALPVYGTISGGSQNTIQTNTSYSTIGGGRLNLVQSNTFSPTIAGGEKNGIYANANFSSIGGGLLNSVASEYTTIGGGQQNIIQTNAAYATIGGGYLNQATNNFATVPGGAGNTAGGKFSFAAGHDAKALHDGTFVWADSPAGGFASTAGNQFLIRAAGGVAIGTNNPNGAALAVNGIVTATSFSGDGAGVTSLNATNLAGTISSARLSANVALRAGGNAFTGNQTIAGNVGIGTVNPGAKLEVAGPAGTSVRVTGPGGLGTTVAFDLATYDPGAGNNPSARIQATDNNYSGTLDFLTKQPGAATNPMWLRLQLNLDGHVNIDPASANDGAIVGQPALAFGDAGSGEGIASKRTSGGNQWGLDFYTGFQNRMTILNNGNIGIGTTTPATALGVRGTVTASSDVTEGFEVSGAAAGYSLHDRVTGAGGRWSMFASDGTLGFYSANAGTTLMRVDDAGNLFTAGAVNPSSDRNAKENFTPLDPRAVLDKVAALPLSEWNYKTDTTTRHVGPMAQDFHAAFGLGVDDKHIATVDADGVALAAIQGLNQKVEAGSQKSEVSIQELRAENAELKQRLERLEQLMNGQNGGAR